MCRAAKYRKEFADNSIGVEVEIKDMMWRDMPPGQDIACVYHGEEALLDITSDMSGKGEATIELIATPVEISSNEGARLRKLAIEAVVRIMQRCIVEQCYFPLCTAEFEWNHMVLSREEEDNIFIISLTVGDNRTELYIRRNLAGCLRAKEDRIPQVICLNDQVSIGMPVTELGSFLDKELSNGWWREGEKAYTYPEETLDYVDEGGTVQYAAPVQLGEGPVKKALADMAYNYIMSIILFAQDGKHHPIPSAENPVLDAEHKNKWSILPRCAPMETAAALIDMAGASQSEFVSLVSEKCVMPVDILPGGERIDMLAERVLQIPGLCHTNISGVRIKGQPGVVFEFRGSRTQYEKFFCSTVVIDG